MKPIHFQLGSLTSPVPPLDDGVSGGLLLGLLALTLPTVGYAFFQLWHLMSGSTLEQAVRAIAS